MLVIALVALCFSAITQRNHSVRVLFCSCSNIKGLDEIEEDLRGRDWSTVPGGLSLQQSLLYRRNVLIKDIEKSLRASAWKNQFRVTPKLIASVRFCINAVLLLLSSAADIGLFSSTAHAGTIPLSYTATPPRVPLRPAGRENPAMTQLASMLAYILPLQWWMSYIDALSTLRCTWQLTSSCRLPDPPHAPSAPPSDDNGWSVDGPDPTGGVILDGVSVSAGGRVHVKVCFPATYFLCQ